MWTKDLLFNMEIYAVPCVFYETKILAFSSLFLFVFRVRIRSTHCRRAAVCDR